MCTKSSMMVEYVFLKGTGIYSIFPCPCVFHVCYLFCKFITICVLYWVKCRYVQIDVYGGVDPRYSSRFPVAFFSSVLFLMFSHRCKEVVWLCYFIFIRYAFTILVNLSPWWVSFLPPPPLWFFVDSAKMVARSDTVFWIPSCSDNCSGTFLNILGPGLFHRNNLKKVQFSILWMDGSKVRNSMKIMKIRLKKWRLRGTKTVFFFGKRNAPRWSAEKTDQKSPGNLESKKSQKVTNLEHSYTCPRAHRFSIHWNSWMHWIHPVGSRIFWSALP